MPSSRFNSYADDRHNRDFDRFRQDEARRFPILSIREECDPLPENKPEPQTEDQHPVP